MKYVLGALAAVSLLVGVAGSQPAAAQERCWWNGYNWHCTYREHHNWWRHHHHWRDWDRDRYFDRY